MGGLPVDQLWQSYKAKCDLPERFLQLVEPINAMDRTVDVVFAALLFDAHDNDFHFDKAILATLHDAFANLQNVIDRRFEGFVETIEYQPDLFFNVSQGLCIRQGAASILIGFTMPLLKLH